MIDKTTRTPVRRKGGAFCLLFVSWIGGLAILSGTAAAQTAGEGVACGTVVVYEGGGAGKVVFDAPRHAAKGLVCADCHESKGLSPALFSMQRGGNEITMRKIELGRSCGHCHEVSMRNTLTCDTCHRK